MFRIALGTLAGLAAGLFVGIIASGGEFTSAAWAFTGVMVGAGITVFVEQLRIGEARRRRHEDWKLENLAELRDATDELERSFGEILTVRLEDINRNDRFRTVHQLHPRTHAFMSAIRRHALLDGPYLGEDLHNLATSYRDATAGIAGWKPEWIEDIDQPLTDDDKEQLRADLKELGEDRGKVFDLLKNQIHVAIGAVLSE